MTSDCSRLSDMTDCCATERLAIDARPGAEEPKEPKLEPGFLPPRSAICESLSTWLLSHMAVASCARGGEGIEPGAPPPVAPIKLESSVCCMLEVPAAPRKLESRVRMTSA